MSYHIARDGTPLGTFTEEEVLAALESGEILPSDELWTEGMEDWQPVEEVIEPEEEDTEAEDKPAVASKEPEPEPEAEPAPPDFADSVDTQVMTPHVASVFVAPAEVRHWPVAAATPAAQVAAQPAVVYRQMAPSLLPGQYGTAGSAIASMVLGILSLVTCFVTGVPAIICGHMARNHIRRSGGVYSGDGLAVTGLILGYVTSTLAVLWIALLIAGVSVPLSQSLQGWGKERHVSGEGRELALALKHYAIAHDNKFPASLDLLAQEHLVDPARLAQLQKTDLGTSWKGAAGWKYLGAGAGDSGAADMPLLISFAADGGGRHLVIYQDASADKAEVRSK